MTTVGVHEAKTRLSELLRAVEAGEEVVVTRGGEAVARIVPIEPPTQPALIAQRGALKHLFGENTGDWDDDGGELAELFGVEAPDET